MKAFAPGLSARRRCLASLLVAPGLLLLAAGARADPLALNGLKRWGSGAYRYFGFHLYDATLWAGKDPAFPPLALKLTYRRKISGQQIVDASIKEMRRLGSDSADLQRWEPRLLELIPDVSAGDSLVGLHTGAGARFLFNQEHRGEIAEREFARQFFAIWLDPKTRAPELRTALLRDPEA